MDCMDDDEWISNWHVGIGWGREVVRGKKGNLFITMV